MSVLHITTLYVCVPTYPSSKHSQGNADIPGYVWNLCVVSGVCLPITHEPGMSVIHIIIHNVYTYLLPMLQP